MFVNVFKATSYATGQLIVSLSNGLFHWTVLYRYVYGNRVEQLSLPSMSLPFALHLTKRETCLFYKNKFIHHNGKSIW